MSNSAAAPGHAAPLPGELQFMRPQRWEEVGMTSAILLGILPHAAVFREQLHRLVLFLLPLLLLVAVALAMRL